MNAFMDISEKWLHHAAYAAAAVGGVVMLAMLGIVGANIVMRPLGGSIRGAVEISGYLCALAVGLCMPSAQAVGSHIAAGLWASSLPRGLRRIEKAACNLMCAGLLALTARELFAVADYAVEAGEYIEGFDISYYGMALGFAFGIALHAVLFLHAALRAFFPARKAKEGA